MATETTVPIDDTGMLSSIMADEPAQAVEQPVEQQAEPERVEQPRDEHGRFAAKTEEQPETVVQPVEAKAEQPEPKDEGGQVPSWRLRELREAREAAERRAEETGRREYALQQQLQALQRQVQQLTTPKAEPVDFFQNPDGALDQRIQPLRGEIDQFKSELRLEMSRELAVVKHGEEAVTEMERAVEQAMREGHPDMQTLAYRMRQSNNPAGIAMQWYRQNKAMTVTGGDPNAWFEKEFDRRLREDPASRTKAAELLRGQATSVAPNGRPNIQLPPSLSKVPASAPERDGDDGDMSDAGLFRQAMR